MSALTMIPIVTLRVNKDCHSLNQVILVTQRAPDRGETFAICKDCNFDHGPFTYAGVEEEEYERD
jgi:hypothetical protein